MIRAIVSILVVVTLCGCNGPHSSGNQPITVSTEANRRLIACKSEIERFWFLPDAAKESFQMGKIEQARSQADEMLRLVATFPEETGARGNAIHDANVVLGRIAISERPYIPYAKDHLMKAATTPGSPQLGSFGPNMTLAKDLVERGEREVVLLYFEKCKTFWPHRKTLDAWASDVKAGKVPRFGANLRY